MMAGTSSNVPCQGCYTQGKTLDEALRNIREVIGLLLEEKTTRDILAAYRPTEISFHTMRLAEDSATVHFQGLRGGSL